MRRARFLTAAMLFIGALFCGSNLAIADGLLIRNGATLILNDSTLDLNCFDLSIENGGTFDLGSGTVKRCGNLIVYTGGMVIWGTGTINYCPVAMPWIPLLLLDD